MGRGGRRPCSHHTQAPRPVLSSQSLSLLPRRARMHARTFSESSPRTTGSREARDGQKAFQQHLAFGGLGHTWEPGTFRGQGRAGAKSRPGSVVGLRPGFTSRQTRTQTRAAWTEGPDGGKERRGRRPRHRCVLCCHFTDRKLRLRRGAEGRRGRAGPRPPDACPSLCRSPEP